MSQDCDKSQCANCQSDCAERKVNFMENANSQSHIKKVIAIMSGKGGVGKSSMTSCIAVALKQKGYAVGILDGDITGPSIPKAFGVKQKAVGNGNGMDTVETQTGIRMMSANLILDTEDTQVRWRGPVIGNAVKQFWTDVAWGDLDVLLIDMPPGTGDVPLTVFQSIPVDGVVIVTTPQDLVSLIVKKSYHMAEKMSIPVCGIIENMSYMVWDDCGKKLYPFGGSKLQKVADEMNIEVLAQLPIQPDIAELCDAGKIEQKDISFLNEAVEKLIQKINL